MLKSVSDSEPDRRAHSVAAEELPVVAPDVNKIAVLLNRNARQVNDKLVAKIEKIVGSDHVFYSHSLAEAEAFAREIVQGGYGTVISGGGDGTLCQTVNMINRYVEESNRWRRQRFERFGEKQSLLGMPRFAFLRLGTGNGIADVVGATDALDDLRKLVSYLPGRTHTIPLCEVDNELCFFAGLGFDSLLLDDYNWMKRNSNNRLLKPLLHTILGYFIALFARTLPRALFGGLKLKVRITSRTKAYYVDPRRGDAAIEMPAGTTLYEGPAIFVGAASSPFYGAGLKIFPFANMVPGYFNLRVANLNPLKGILRLWRIWRGTYRSSSNVFDFLVRDVHIELAEPFPFQHSGDPQGSRTRIDIRIAEADLSLVDFLPPVQMS